jgi:pyruvate dehydrogenase E2 component (dihydrolipoamide acetyltransferase)
VLGDVDKERISEADVKDYLERKGGGVTEALEPLSPVQKVVAARMSESFRDIPQFSLRFVVDMRHLFDLLERFRARSTEKLTINHLMLRATALALSREPEVQRQYRGQGMYRPPEVNLGVAVAAGDDLFVPVICNADKKGLIEIAREAVELAEKALARTLAPEQLQGGTFTVTNLGMFGISSFTPIVNPGQGGILGIGAVSEIPRVSGGKLVVGKAVELTLVCDHRSVNGAIAAAFCRTFKEIAENEEQGAW